MAENYEGVSSFRTESKRNK